MKVEWDSLKEAGNVAKHGLSFRDALEVFRDPQLLVADATRPEDGEARYRAVGLIGGRLFTVVFTRRGEHYRLISARRSNRKETRGYADRA